jgi:hypothetical protein
MHELPPYGILGNWFPAVPILGNRIIISFSLIRGIVPQPNPRHSADGILALLLGFSFAIAGWTLGPHGLSLFGGYYPKQRSRTGREGTRGPLHGVARRGGLSAKRRSLWAALGGGGRSPRLPNERDPQLVQSRGANNRSASLPARGGRPRARRPADNERAFGPVPLFLTLHLHRAA